AWSPLRAFWAERTPGSAAGSCLHSWSSWLGMGPDEKFSVAVAAVNGAGEIVAHGQAVVGAGGADALLDEGERRFVLDQPALADLLRLQLELRLDQHQQVAVRRDVARQGRQHQRHRDERDVAGD